MATQPKKKTPSRNAGHKRPAAVEAEPPPSKRTKRETEEEEMVLGLEVDLIHALVLDCSCPIETPDAIRMFSLSRAGEDLTRWTISRQVRTIYSNRVETQVSEVLHRVDGPAVEHTSPAVEHLDGTKEWWLFGKRHRLDGPAVERVDGEKMWYVDDKLHRVDGPAIEYADGEKEWYVDDKRHRVDGPAIEYVNGTEWWVNDKRHRLDGPAVERKDGTKEWWIDDKRQPPPPRKRRSRRRR